MSEIDLNFKAEKIVQSEHNERYTCIISCNEGNGMFLLGTNSKKLLIYNEDFSTQKTFIIIS